MVRRCGYPAARRKPTRIAPEMEWRKYESILSPWSGSKSVMSNEGVHPAFNGRDVAVRGFGMRTTARRARVTGSQAVW